MQLQIAKVVLTNNRLEPGAGWDELAAHLAQAAALRPALHPAARAQASFPSSAEDLAALPTCWADYLKLTSRGYLRVNAVPSPPPPHQDSLGYGENVVGNT